MQVVAGALGIIYLLERAELVVEPTETTERVLVAARQLTREAVAVVARIQARQVVMAALV